MKYLLTIQIPIEPMDIDDIGARVVSKDIQRFIIAALADDEIPGMLDRTKWRLQEVFDDKPPRKIEI